VNVDTWGFKYTEEEQREIFTKLAFIPFEGRVRLKDAQHIFWFVSVDKLGNNGLPELPRRMYFVRQVVLSNR
jgi:tRNA (guanine10-N2)-methyltransferase